MKILLVLFFLATGVSETEAAEAPAISNTEHFGFVVEPGVTVETVSKRAIVFCLKFGGLDPKVVAVSWAGASHPVLGKGPQSNFGWAFGSGRTEPKSSDCKGQKILFLILCHPAR